MKAAYLLKENGIFYKKFFHTLIALLLINIVNAQIIKVPATSKQQRIIITYSKDVFYLEPAILMGELIWYNKFTGENNYSEEIKYLRMANEKIEFVNGQKEFRNMSENKIYQLLIKLLPKLISEAKVAHFDKNLKKKSMTLKVEVCDEKKPTYATIITEKGKVIFDCEGKYLPQ